jgi:hypothetical protein
MTLTIMRLTIMTFIKMAFSITTLTKMTLTVMRLTIMTFSKMTLSITTLTTTAYFVTLESTFLYIYTMSLYQLALC